MMAGKAGAGGMGDWDIWHGDCLDLLPTIAEGTIGAVCTDPPYGIHFMGKKWDQFGSAIGVDHNTTRERSGSMHAGLYDHRQNRAFQAWCEAWGRECLRALKPGGYLVSFGSPRTYHRLACGLEDAGFVVKDSLHWMFGSGFPKSVRLNRDPAFCQCGELGRSGGYSNPSQSRAFHIDMGLASRGGVPLPGDAPHSSHTLSSSPVDCPADSDSGGGHAPQAGAGDLASLPLPGDAQAHTHSDERGDDRADESSHSPCPAQHSDRPSSRDSADPSTSAVCAPSGTPVSIAASGSTPTPRGNGTSASRKSRTASQSSAYDSSLQNQYSMGFPICEHCGKPNIDGLGTALKPAHEPIILAQKPLDGTYVGNVLRYGVGGLEIDGCRVDGGERPLRVPAGRTGDIYGAGLEGGYAAGDTSLGRWPTNLLLTHHPDCNGACVPGCPVAVLDDQAGERGGAPGVRRNRTPDRGVALGGGQQTERDSMGYGDGGSASRFYPTFRFEADDFAPFLYMAKAARSEREKGLRPLAKATPGARTGRKEGSAGLDSPRAGAGRTNAGANIHPTVKPLALMRWLVRLVTPPGQMVLDPFLGSGTTGVAALMEGRGFVGIEREAAYLAIARRRLVTAQPGLPLGAA